MDASHVWACAGEEAARAADQAIVPPGCGEQTEGLEGELEGEGERDDVHISSIVAKHVETVEEATIALAAAGDGNRALIDGLMELKEFLLEHRHSGGGGSW